MASGSLSYVGLAGSVVFAGIADSVDVDVVFRHGEPAVAYPQTGMGVS
jgi:hypothetical protein